MRRPVSCASAVAPRIDGGNRRVAGQRDAQRLDHAGHRRRRAHRHAVALRAMHARFGGGEFLLRHLAGAHVFRHLPDARAGADLLAAELAVQHRPAGNTDRRQVAARRAHQQRRAWSCRSPSAARRRPSDCRESIPRHPCWRDCGTASRWAAAAFRPATSPGIRAGIRRLRSTPRFTNSASSRKWPLQGVSSVQVLQMPMTGRPSNMSSG